MISYNPKDWLRFIFNFHKADTVRKLLPLLFAMAIYSWFIAYLEIEYFKLADSSYLKNMTLLHNLLGFALSMLLVFRTNTAYDRWWEGRRLWGSLINNSRNLAIKLDSFLPKDDLANRSFFMQLIPRFAFELRNHLQSEQTRFELDENPHPEIPDFDRTKHVPNQVVSLVMKRINHLYNQKSITGEQLLFLNNELMSLLDICGSCERIKNTPIPYSYSSFIKKFVFIYVVTLPIGYVFSLGYLVIPVVMFIFYVLASLELIAEEIEDPFGKDTNDLPMQRMAETIQKNLTEILQ
ncbi:MAG TPA: bestrophin family ion channel [Flavisolibacter sp.]|nr:bestrophin family ion channel [Flavisolibacter sp.]